jgi:hypothetical protein
MWMPSLLHVSLFQIPLCLCAGSLFWHTSLLLNALLLPSLRVREMMRTPFSNSALFWQPLLRFLLLSLLVLLHALLLPSLRVREMMRTPFSTSYLFALRLPRFPLLLVKFSLPLFSLLLQALLLPSVRLRERTPFPPSPSGRVCQWWKSPSQASPLPSPEIPLPLLPGFPPKRLRLRYSSGTMKIGR